MQFHGVDFNGAYGVDCAVGLTAGKAMRCLSAAQRMVHIAYAGQCFFAKLAETYSQMSIHSHGDHIPRDVCHSATFAWWLPDLLVFDYNALSQDRSKREAFWKPRLEAIEILSDYVRDAVTCFQWPDAWRLGKQYKC